MLFRGRSRCRLLLMNDALVDCGDAFHVLTDQAGQRSRFAVRGLCSQRAMNCLQLPFIGGKSVRLLPLPNLKPVLRLPKKGVAGAQNMEIVAAEVFLVMQLLQREQRAA